MSMPEQRLPVEYATKADLEILRQQIRADLAELRTEFAELKVALLRQHAWMLVAMTAVFSAVVVVAKLFP